MRKLFVFVAGPMFLMYTFLYLTWSVWVPVAWGGHTPAPGPPFNPVSFGVHDWPVTPLWYLASLVTWRFMLLLLGAVAPGLMFTAAICLSLVGGYWGGVGSGVVGGVMKKFAHEGLSTDQVTSYSNTEMAFERTLGNLPFFVAGHVFWPRLEKNVLTMLHTAAATTAADAESRKHDGGPPPSTTSKKRWIVPAAGAAAALLLAVVTCATGWSSAAYSVYGMYYQTHYLSGWLSDGGSVDKLQAGHDWPLLWTRRAMYLVVSSALGFVNTIWLPTFEVPVVSQAGKNSLYPYVLQISFLALCTRVRDAAKLGVMLPHSGWWVLALAAQPIVIVLLSSRFVRFCFWPLIEPFWLNAIMHRRRELPWAHPDLEGRWGRAAWAQGGCTRAVAVIAHVARVVIWIMIIVSTLAWKILSPVQHFSATPAK
jgi:hypothetical protein